VLNNEKALALEYFGKRKTFKQVDKIIDEFARSFISLNGHDRHSITYCIPSLPEGILSFYALNKMNIRANFVSYHFLQTDSDRYISDNESSTLIVFDKFYPLIKESLEKTDVKKIILTSVASFMPFYMKTMAGGDDSIKNVEKMGVKLNPKFEYINMTDFIKDGKKRKDLIASQYKQGETAVHLYTSGSKEKERIAEERRMKSPEELKLLIEEETKQGYIYVKDMNFYQPDRIKDQHGRRWLKCEICGEIKRDNNYIIYRSAHGVNYGRCIACSHREY